jgi:acetyltransferase-like isoleucine patch superfamily enzyme
MKYEGENKKFDFSGISILRMLVLVFAPIIVYSLAALPSILLIGGYLHYATMYFSHWLLPLIFLPVILVISFLLLILSTVFFSGMTIKIFHLTYEPGRYHESIKDKNAFHFALYFVLYRPTVKLLGIFFISPLFATYLRMVGAKIGKNVFFGGRNTISDPCVVEIGDNTLIGGGATIMGHLGEDKLVISKVVIEDHCLVGAEALLMPGVHMKHHSVVGGKSLVTKNKVLDEHTMYGGVPIKVIKENK